jgi:hypothetical protein
VHCFTTVNPTMEDGNSASAATKYYVLKMKTQG